MINFTAEEKRKYVYDFRGIIHLRSIAKGKNISESQLYLIIKGDRTDHYNVINDCYDAIEKKLQAIMLQHK